MCWDTDTDQFYFDFSELIHYASGLPMTRRSVLKLTGRVFDPLGFLSSPVMIRMKTDNKINQGKNKINQGKNKINQGKNKVNQGKDGTVTCNNPPHTFLLFYLSLVALCKIINVQSGLFEKQIGPGVPQSSV